MEETHFFDSSQYFKYYIINAGNTRKAIDIDDAVTNSDGGYYVLCSPDNGHEGNYFVSSYGTTVLQTLENFHGHKLDADKMYIFEKENCFSYFALFPASNDLYKLICKIDTECSGSFGFSGVFGCSDEFLCHTKKKIAYPGHRKSTTSRLLSFKGLRQVLRKGCNEKLDALKARLKVVNDKELSFHLHTNIRVIRNLRVRGSLCTLSALYK